jgi:hypothetical protein
VVGRWVFKLATLLDDLRLLDSLMRADWKDEPTNTVAFFRMIVTRLYEGRSVVREMEDGAAVLRFLTDEVPSAADASAVLLDAYRRPDPHTKSNVERTYATVRHLTVHYSTSRGELARILRNAGDIYRDDEEPSLVYLFPQDVIEETHWSDHAVRDAELAFAHELLQAVTRLFTRVMAATSSAWGLRAKTSSGLAPHRTSEGASRQAPPRPHSP